jgi:hypothetical protein
MGLIRQRSDGLYGLGRYDPLDEVLEKVMVSLARRREAEAIAGAQPPGISLAAKIAGRAELAVQIPDRTYTILRRSQ